MFKIRSFARKNLGWWLKQINSIDFDPDFQRTSRVWKGRNQAFLIDSILNGFDIPKIYIADFTNHNIPSLNIRRKDYAIIDGKQRMTAVFDFMNDKFPLPRKFFLLSNPTLALGGLTFTQLKAAHSSIAQIIERYVLDVKSLETDDRKIINDVFLRLNMASMALNGAEIRNAMIGKAVATIRGFSKHRFFTQRIRFATNRSQEKNAVAKILLLEYQGGVPVDTKKKNLDALVTEIGEQNSARLKATAKRIQKHLDTLATIFQNHDALLGAQGHIPLYYLFISKLHVKEQKKVKAFLEHFERQRIKNRKGGGSDRILNEYDLASRSTNDKGSFETRLRILRKKLAQWKPRQ